MATKNWSLLEIAGLGGLIYVGFVYLADYVMQEVTFGVPAVSFGPLTWSGVDVDISIPITNNTAVPIPIDYLKGHIAYGRYAVAPFELQQPTTIAANATTELEFRSRIIAADLAGNLAALITDGNFLQALQVRGMATVKQVNIPFSNTISVG